MSTKKWAVNVEGAKTISVMEDKRKKRVILGLASCAGFFSAAFSGVYLFRFVHVTNYQIITDDIIKAVEAGEIPYHTNVPFWSAVDQPYDTDCILPAILALLSGYNPQDDQDYS